MLEILVERPRATDALTVRVGLMSCSVTVDFCAGEIVAWTTVRSARTERNCRVFKVGDFTRTRQHASTVVSDQWIGGSSAVEVLAL